MLNSEGESETGNVCEKDVIKKKVTPKDIEKWEVALLDSNIEPCSCPSDLFDKLETKRRIRHEKLLQQLAKNLHDVNINTEKNISLSSTELKAHIKNFEEKLKTMLEDIDAPEVTSYCSSVFIELQSKANEYKSEQETLIKELYEDLIKFENERAEENEKYLQEACEEMRKIGYFFPYEIQTFVEHETLKMNQLSLNNRRCYEDVKLTLTLVTEQTYKSFMDKVYCIREKWIQRQLLEAYYELQNDADKKIANIVPEAYTRLEIKGQELVLHMMPDNLYNTCKAQEWSENVEKAVANIDYHGQNLINTYKEIMEAVYKGFDKEVKEIKSRMCLTENLDFEERIIQPIIFETESSQKEIQEFEFFWQKTLEGIRNHLKDVRDFLLDAGKLWDSHSERIYESKKLILKALEKDKKTNQDVLQEMETKLNMSLDALRQEHNPAKLQKAYEAVVAILNSMKAKYESMYLNDVSTIEDFYKMMDLEADVLSADIKEFIYETHQIDQSKILHSFNEQVPFLSRGKLLIKEIQLCATRIQAVRWWKKGVWIALEILSDKTRETLRPRAENWVESKIKFLAEQKSIQLELLDKRYQRVKSEIYDKRLEEIEQHQQVFARHKEKIETGLAKTKKDFQLLTAGELSKLNLIKDNLAEVEMNARLENRARVIRNNQTMLEKKKEELENDLKMTFERFRADCNAQSSDLKQENIKFMKSIKLFHENGNYNSDEGKAFVTSLEVLDKKIDTDIKSVISNSTKEESEFIKKLSAIFNPVIAIFGLLYEETQFSQDTKQRLRNFAADIKDHAKNLKLDYGYLNQQSYFLCMTIKSPGRNAQDIDDKVWDVIIELLYKNVSSLLYPVSPPETPDESKSTEEDEVIVEEATPRPPCCCADKFSVHLSTVTFRTTEKEVTITCKDYKPELFNCDKRPDKDGTFMSLICNVFWTEMDYFQSLACNFYKKLQGRKLIRTDLVPPDYDQYMSEIISKCRNYNTQIEQFWLQIILDFLPLFGRIKSLANYYLEEKLLKYESLALRAIEEYEKEFLSCLEVRKSENCQELERLEKKLLPLYGYPNNENLLNNLEEEVVRRSANQGVKWEALIKKFTSQLKCFRVYHIKDRKEIDKIKPSYLKLRDTIFAPDLADGVLTILYDYCNRGEFYIKAASSAIIDNENKSQTTPEQDKEQILDNEMISETRVSVHLYINKLKKIIERERLSDTALSECPPCPEESIKSYHGEDLCGKLCEPKLDVLLEIMDFEEYVQKILEGLDNYIRRLKGFASNEEKAQEVELFNWLKKWKVNVRKVLRLYRVKYEEKPEILEETAEVPSVRLHTSAGYRTDDATELKSCSPASKDWISALTIKIALIAMADFDDIPKLKSRFQESREILHVKQTQKGGKGNSQTNLPKLKFTEFNHSDQISSAEPASLQQNSFRNYHGQIPVRYRHSLNHLRMPQITTRSPSPLKKGSPKEKFSNKVKIITLDPETKKKKTADNSRSSSPIKMITCNNVKLKQRTAISPPSFTNSEKIEGKRIETKRTMSTKFNAKTQKSKDKSAKDLQVLNKDLKNSVILKQASQPSLSVNAKIQPQEKISLDHLKSEVYEGDRTRLSYEKVHLCIEKSMDNLALKENKSSYFVTYSAENGKNPDDTSLSFLQNISSTSFTSYSSDSQKGKPMIDSQSAIKTLSGHELILTPSMKLEIDIDKEDLGSEDLEISDILHEEGGNLDDQKEIQIPQDDANEYDSEMSTDGEMVVKGVSILPSRVSGSRSSELHRKNALWKSREAEMLSDVDYRQSVYHPAVSRRHKTESVDMEFRGKSKSFENNHSGQTHTYDDRSHISKHKYTNTPSKQTSSNDDSPWISSFDKTDGKSFYNSVIPAGSFYGMRRIRSKRERVSGALLHFTLKMIRLLAIFNLWPGDNCHMLTSQSLTMAS